MKRPASLLPSAFLLLALLASCAPGAVGAAETFRPLTPEYELSASMAGSEVATVRTADGWRLDAPAFGMTVGFDDDRISSVWGPLVQGVDFVLENRSAEPIRILWDESAFVGLTGVSSRVFHYGVRFEDASQSQPATIVPPGALADDGAFPTAIIQEVGDDEVRLGYIIGHTDVTPAHSVFRLHLALEVAGERTDLALEFDNPAPILATPTSTMAGG